MQISTDNVTEEIESVSEVEAKLRKLAACGANEIWISGKEKFPALAVLVNGNAACVEFFGEDEEEMFLSRGNGCKEAVFTAGGEEWTAPPDAVIGLDDAIKCVKEFCHSFDKPLCIEWQDGV